MSNTFIVDPSIKGDLRIGTEGTDLSVLIGRLAESGPLRSVFFGGSKEFVTLIIGKRGSGKSHTLGTILEGLATATDSNSIAQHSRRQAVLLLDPMGNFWTAAVKLTPDGPAKVREQYAMLDGWGFAAEDVNAKVWIPAGFKTEIQPDFVREFRVNVADLDAADIADLIGVNLIRDPQGAALAEAYIAVAEEGWSQNTVAHPPKADFTFSDLIVYLEHLRDHEDGGDHNMATLKALIRSLKALCRQPVFSGTGTPLRELLVVGTLGILMLPHRIGSDLRRVIARLLIRRILRERYEASQIRQRLDVECLDSDTRGRLERELSLRIPRSVLAIDEAQELMGDEGGEARTALEEFCLMGRNYGLSLLLATQRPTASAISSKVRSQVDLNLIHRLLTQEDIELASKNLLTVNPDEVRLRDRQLDFPGLVRSLERGQVIISGATMSADGPVARTVVANVRPRMTVHGGEVE